jgi:hypothetical protein
VLSKLTGTEYSYAPVYCPWITVQIGRDARRHKRVAAPVDAGRAFLQMVIKWFTTYEERVGGDAVGRRYYPWAGNIIWTISIVAVIQCYG